MGGDFHRHRAQDSEEEKAVILTSRVLLTLLDEFLYHP